MLCVFLLQKKIIKQGNETAFLTETSSVISHLQEQDVISHQLVKPVTGKQFYPDLSLWEWDSTLLWPVSSDNCRRAIMWKCTSRRRRAYREPSFFTKNKRLSSHTEYQFNSGDNIPYIASVGSIPKGDSYLNFLILRSLAEQSHQMLSLRIIVIIANIAAFLLLFLFFHFFIRKC